MEGIEKELKVPKELKCDIRRLAADEKIQMGIRGLPENLGEALKAMQGDHMILDTLGEDYLSLYVNVKRKEWKNYLEQITQWELSQYLYRI